MLRRLRRTRLGLILCTNSLHNRDWSKSSALLLLLKYWHFISPPYYYAEAQSCTTPWVYSFCSIWIYILSISIPQPRKLDDLERPTPRLGTWAWISWDWHMKNNTQALPKMPLREPFPCAGNSGLEPVGFKSLLITGKLRKIWWV
jgi:hypothetical protein